MTRLLIRLFVFVAVLLGGVNNGFATSICWQATAFINGQLSWSTLADNKQYVEEAKRLGLDCQVKSNIEAFNLDVASNCLLDPNECTPKGLCEVATEVTNGNKLWSTSTTSSKHVSFAQELGMNCGVVELKDPCDTDPSECKIKQLCEKATIDDAGTKRWNSEAQAYVTVAQEYGLSCDVVEELKAEADKCKDGDTKSVKCRPIPVVPSDEETQVSGKCSRDNTSKCSNHYICAYAKGPAKNDGWTVMTAWQPYVREAKSRGLTCGVGGSEAFSSWSDALICKYVKKGLIKHIQEAKSRGLTCDFNGEEQATSHCNQRPAECTSEQLCARSTYKSLIVGQTIWQTSSGSKKFVQEAKRRGLTCGVTEIKYKLKSYKTYEFTSKKGKGEITIGVVNRNNEWYGERLYTWPSGEALFRIWKESEQDTYRGNSNINQVFPPLKLSFGKKSKSERQRIQRKLKAKNLYDSTIDGLWGRNTLLAITDYSSKRLRTIRLTDPQIVATLMDQILSDTSSGDVALASSEVINEVYAYLENADKLKAKSDAFASSFKKQTKLKRQQIQYALRYLDYYNSDIDGLWGNGTRTALTSFASGTNLSNSQPNYVIAHLLSLVDVPTSFAGPKKTVTTSSKSYYKGLRPILSNPSTSAEQAWAICKPQAELARSQARSSYNSSNKSFSCDFIGRSAFCDKGVSGGAWSGINQAYQRSRAGNKAESAVMSSCLAQYGWK